MGGHALEHPDLTASSRLGAGSGLASKTWNRFGQLNRLQARWALGVLLVALVLSALVPIRNQVAGSGAAFDALWDRTSSAGSPPEQASGTGHAGALHWKFGRFTRTEADLALYDLAIRRLAGGESYYGFIVTEQRAIGYPVRPALAFRLPTLALISAWVTPDALPFIAWALVLATLLVWWRRLGLEPGMARFRVRAVGLLFVGMCLALNPYYLALHELWSGLLLVLSIGLYRAADDTGKAHWCAALVVAALALFIRELALPFVVLMAALALWHRQGREGAAWCVLLALFLAVLAWHLHVLSQQALVTDRPGPGWLTWRGPSGWLSNIVMASPLRILPHWLAGPLMVLMMLGWISWRSHLANVMILFQAGYALAFMIVGRWDNFYWGLMVLPGLFVGLAFAPRAASGLWRSGFASSGDRSGALASKARSVR